jgi:multidrug efflux pump subunit AcrA (membrane-fusion protein)
VKISLDPTGFPGLRLGLNGTASVVLKEDNQVLTLPASAVGNNNGTSFVYLKSGQNYVEKPLQIGIENGGFVEILGGVSEGDHVYAKK